MIQKYFYIFVVLHVTYYYVYVFTQPPLLKLAEYDTRSVILNQNTTGLNPEFSVS